MTRFVSESARKDIRKRWAGKSPAFQRQAAVCTEQRNSARSSDSTRGDGVAEHEACFELTRRSEFDVDVLAEVVDLEALLVVERSVWRLVLRCDRSARAFERVTDAVQAEVA